jgi:hypothetical protein
MVVHLFFVFSESDVALIIKYTFHDEEMTNCSADNKTKKRKINDIKRNNVIDYSYIKLPALMFGQYLDQDSEDFIADCSR